MPYIDTIVNCRFGRLQVTSILATRGRRKASCICDCGNSAIVDARMLKAGHTRSCGCLHKDQLRARNSAELLGKRFERLVVLAKGPIVLSGSRGRSNISWVCQCDCGNTTSVTSNSLLSGNTKSCGCLNKDRTRAARYKEGSLRTIVRELRVRAEDRHLDWLLSDEQALRLLNGDCHYCGAEPSIRARLPKFPRNGIDRVDNGLGYLETNVVSCCPTCNQMKHAQEYQKFIDQVMKISALHSNKGT